MPKLFKIEYHVKSAWPLANGYDVHRYVFAADGIKARSKLFAHLKKEGTDNFSIIDVQEIRNILM